MIGISIETGFTCPSCERFVPLNALAESIRCPACGDVHPLGVETWRSLLEDALQEAPRFSEGEGRDSTLIGKTRRKIRYGRLMPRFAGTKEDIPLPLLLEGLPIGRVLHPRTGAPTSVRPVPEFCVDFLRGVAALVGEDPSLLPGRPGADTVELDLEKSASGATPVAFQCPGCGGSLIVDDSARKAVCGHCGTEAVMPDDLWQRLHPAGKSERWFLLLDPCARPLRWDDTLLGAAAGPEGDLYLAVENPEGDRPLIARIRSDWTPVWIRSDLDVAPSLDDEGHRLLTAPGGDLLVPAPDGRILLRLSRDDGSTLATLGGSPAGAEADPGAPASFTMEGCRSMTCLPDGSLLLLVDRQSGDDPGDLLEFRRFGIDGAALPIWPAPVQGEPPKPRQGFLARLKTLLARPVSTSASTSAYRLDRIGDRPRTTRESDLHLFSGPDGSVCMYSHPWLVAFDSNGDLRYRLELRDRSFTGRPLATGDGRVLILGEDDDCRMRVMEVSPDGASVSPCPAHHPDGETLDDGEVLVLSSETNLYLLGYGGFRILMKLTV